MLLIQRQRRLFVIRHVLRDKVPNLRKDLFRLLDLLPVRIQIHQGRVGVDQRAFLNPDEGRIVGLRNLILQLADFIQIDLLGIVPLMHGLVCLCQIERGLVIDGQIIARRHRTVGLLQDLQRLNAVLHRLGVVVPEVARHRRPEGENQQQRLLVVCQLLTAVDPLVQILLETVDLAQGVVQHIGEPVGQDPGDPLVDVVRFSLILRSAGQGAQIGVAVHPFDESRYVLVGLGALL